MNWVAITGYGLAACAYLAFFLLLVVIRKKSFVAVLITVNVFITLAAVLIGLMQVYFSNSLKPVLLLENIKLLTLLVLLFGARSRLTSFSALLGQSWLSKYILTAAALSGASWWFAHHTQAGSNSLFLLFLVLNLSIMVLLEQLYRNAEAREKWTLWPLVISIGSISVVDFIIFAQAAMLDQLDFDFWFARGYVIALGMPFFLISARRIKDWSVDVFVSREVVFYSSMLLISGIYLLVLSSAGYALRFIGGQWGDVLSISFAVLGLSVLAALLITEKLRREVKVFIAKHFFANKYDYRIEWLKSIEQIEANNHQDCYQTAIKAICTSIGAPSGALLRKQTDGKYKIVGTEQLQITMDARLDKTLEAINEFCHRTGWIIDIEEYRFVEDSYPNLTFNVELLNELKVDLIVPIKHDNQLYGMFLLARGQRASAINWEDRDLLFAVTKQLRNYLSLNEANNELAESKQFEAFHRMSAFLVHDLKNIQAQLALINKNSEKHRDNPEFIDDVFDTVMSASGRLEKVLAQLRNKQLSPEKEHTVPLRTLVNRLVAQRNINQPSVDVEINGELNLVVNEELSAVVSHIVQNAQEATPNDGWVKLVITQADDQLTFTISDNGCGMSDEFIKHRLFKPFDTTKGNAGMGIGVYEAKQFVEGQGGSIVVISEEHKGSTFTLNLPYQLII